LIRIRTWSMVLVAVLMVFAACGDEEQPDPGATASPSPSASAEPSPEDSPSDEPSTEPEPQFTVEIVVKGGSVKGPDSVDVKVGDKVSIAVTSDVADHVHVHGYDKLVDVEPGKQAVLRFTADLPGVWEVELEDAGKQLLELKVS
jgi:heme/copper-type cytochrome/quinol oxidase subunit 2